MITVDCPDPSAQVAHLLRMRRNRNTRWSSRNPHLRIAPDGRMFAFTPEGAADPRGRYTLTILQLDERPDLDLERSEKFSEVLGLIAIIIYPEATPPIVGEAWRLLQDTLGGNRPHLAIVQQLFTAPSEENGVKIERLYRAIPEARDLLAHFRRPIGVEH